jgi:monoamine oxidase
MANPAASPSLPIDSLDRRTFLRYVAAAGAVALADRAAAPSPAAAASPRGGNRVVVLGAGLAGLAAAYNLMHHGYDVIVLEAQDRPGGRVLTVRDRFRRGGHAEMGAVRIPESHAHTLKYVDEFGLEITPYDTGTRAFHLQGKRFLAPPAGTPWPLDGFAPGEQPDPSALLPAYLLSGFDRIGDVFDPGWPGAFPAALELDATTLSGYMRAQGASETWLDWLFAQEGRIGRTNAAAGFAVESLSGGAILGSIEGGNDRLPYAFASALGRRIKYRSPVVRIAQDDEGVTVGFTDRSGRHEVRADRCVCALPFAPLRRVAIATPFSQQKMDAIHKLQYMAAARCYFQTRTRFWRDDPLGPLGGLNLVGTDTMAGRVWNTSSQQADPQLGMVHAYMFDTEALEFASHGHRRVVAMRNLFQRLLPGIRGQIVGVAHRAWQEDPWAGGGWGWTQPGELQWMFPAMRRPDGRVHFAGEHTSLWIAYMNGAIESGERAVGEILQADARPQARSLAAR